MNDVLYLNFIRHLLKILEDSDNHIQSLEKEKHELKKKLNELSGNRIPTA